MISIIIPVLNEEDTMEKTLRQFEELSLAHETIVSDSGSKDNTVAVALKYADRVVTRPEGSPDFTIAANRNRGAEAARGEFLVFMDAGCRIGGMNDFFKKALSDFDRNPKLVGLTSGIYVFPESATFTDNLIFGIMTFCFVLINALGWGGAQGKFQMVKASAFRKAGGFREDLVASEDMDMFHRLNKIGRTSIDVGLKVYHSGRRVHALGWPRLLFIWWRDSVWLIFFNRAYSRNWKRVDKKA